MRAEFEKAVLAATRRLRHLADGLEYAQKIHGFPRDFTALKEYFIHEIKDVRELLWQFREDADGKFVDNCTKALEDAIRGVQEKDFGKAAFALNTAYGFLARVSLSASGLEEELHSVERTAWWKGIAYGLLGGAAIGMAVLMLAISIFLLAK